uniref:NADH-ubiquinone oxidoreductase chain 5 n=1 Tax=Levensteiniella iris TaxID=2153341 RepID=A0A343W671_9ANNE|nr:NADH dehydrogenase subunit 5 [Levensteiniella iris]
MLFSPLPATKILWILFPIPLILSTILFSSNLTIILTWDIFSLNSTFYSFPIILDPYGTLFSSTVLFISANVMQFAIPYMQGEKFMHRFSSLVLLFVLSMNLLIFIPHMICLLLGWDGLGIVSFILVIYYQNPKSLAAGMITALMNRIGDVMILLTIALMLNLGHWNILFLWHSPSSLLISILILTAGFTKSAQIPFSSWLPAAMAAPTPVSALVHSSTLVTAGVFLLFRFHYILIDIPLYKEILLTMASLTMLMAGSAATAECDMKKVIALSTLSQLGVMMGSLGLNLPNLAFFHLLTHALFKALLFLAAGSMINFHSHSQDLRFMGNLIMSSPLTTSSLLIANLALCGSPFFAGFYSKDLILEMSLFNPTNMMILLIFMTATMLTSAYTIRFLVSVIWNASNSLPFQYTNDSTTNFTSPMILLTMGAICSGAALNWLSFNSLPEPFLPFYLKLTPLIVTLMGGFIAWYITSMLSSYSLTSPLSSHFLSSMWFLTPLTSQGMISSPLNLSHTALKSIDSGWLETLGSQGIFTTMNYYSNRLKLLSKSKITAYLSLSLIWLLIWTL